MSAAIEFKRCASGSECVNGNPFQSVANFYASPGEKDGYKYKCKACTCKIRRDRYAKKKGAPVMRQKRSKKESRIFNPCYLWGKPK